MNHPKSMFQLSGVHYKLYLEGMWIMMFQLSGFDYTRKPNPQRLDLNPKLLKPSILSKPLTPEPYTRKLQTSHLNPQPLNLHPP